MNLETAFSAGNLIYLAIVGVGGLILNSIRGRIDKMEESLKETIKELKEVSRRDDESLERRYEKEMDRRIENVVSLHAKVESLQSMVSGVMSSQGERIARMEGIDEQRARE